GSINISNDSMIRFLVDIGTSLSDQGFTTFVMINGHLGNQVALKEAARVLYEKRSNMKVYYFFYLGMIEVVKEVRDYDNVHNTYFHACDIETSYMLYLEPEFVELTKSIHDNPNIPNDADVTRTS